MLKCIIISWLTCWIIFIYSQSWTKKLFSSLFSLFNKFLIECPQLLKYSFGATGGVMNPFSDACARVTATTLSDASRGDAWRQLLPSRLQAGVPVRGPGGGDQPPLPRLLRGARRVPPAARPAALQLRRLQRQIPAPLPLQGLPQRPGGAVQGLPMTRAGSCGRPALSLDTLKGKRSLRSRWIRCWRNTFVVVFFSHEVAVESNAGSILSVTVHGHGSYPNKI